MKNSTIDYSKTKQAVLPLFISDYLNICDPVLVFDRFMEEIDLEKYLRNLPAHVTGRIRYNPTSMVSLLKKVRNLDALCLNYKDAFDMKILQPKVVSA